MYDNFQKLLKRDLLKHLCKLIEHGKCVAFAYKTLAIKSLLAVYYRVL